MSENLYTILGLERSATAEEIKQAYRTLARKYHPDAQNPNASETLFRKISEAYSVLSSKDRRGNYDDSLPPIVSNIEKKRNQIFKEMDAVAQVKPKEAPLPQEIQPNKESGIMGKLTKILKIREDDSSTEFKSSDHNLRGERIYKFCIDALESLTGTTRELALKGDNNHPRMLKVKIPARTCDGDHLRVRNELENEEYLINITITPHEYVSREGSDIILKIPITIGEALEGVTLQLPLLSGTIPLSIPANWDVKKRIRLKGKGVERSDPSASGDLYVELRIINPDREIPQVGQISKLIDEGYSVSPRAKFPKDFQRKS